MPADIYKPVAFPLDGTWQPVGVCLQQSARGLEAELFGDADAQAAQRQTARILSLDVDGTGYPAVGERDPVVGRLQQAHRYLRPVLFYSPYEAVAAAYGLPQPPSEAQLTTIAEAWRPFRTWVLVLLRAAVPPTRP
ncbi:MAG: hypothetical protein ACYCW6_21790 [Candidatus Xenobia bacterium]